MKKITEMESKSNESVNTFAFTAKQISVYKNDNEQKIQTHFFWFTK